jgi:hypothetical protein
MKIEDLPEVAVVFDDADEMDHLYCDIENQPQDAGWARDDPCRSEYY